MQLMTTHPMHFVNLEQHRRVKYCMFVWWLDVCNEIGDILMIDDLVELKNSPKYKTLASPVAIILCTELVVR